LKKFFNAHLTKRRQNMDRKKYRCDNCGNYWHYPPTRDDLMWDLKEENYQSAELHQHCPSCFSLNIITGKELEKRLAKVVEAMKGKKPEPGSPLDRALKDKSKTRKLGLWAKK